jgi:hypothetical protein
MLGCAAIKVKIKEEKKIFLGTISNVLHDLPFTQNQPLKSAVGQYIIILKNRKVWLS